MAISDHVSGDHLIDFYRGFRIIVVLAHSVKQQTPVIHCGDRKIIEPDLQYLKRETY